MFAVSACETDQDPSSPTKYTVTFAANGGTVSPLSITVEKGKTAAQLPTPTKTDGDTIFWGWYTKNGTASGDWGSRFTTTTPVTADMIVYARWGSTQPPVQYTVTFNADGGTVSPTSKQVISGDPAGELPTPTKPSNTFGGWYTAQNGGGSAFTSATTVTGNITVYAKWTAGENNTNPGETNIGTSVHLGNTITISNMPVYEDVEGTLTPMNNVEPIELEHVDASYIYESSYEEYEQTIIGGKISKTIPKPEPEKLGTIRSDLDLVANPAGVKGLTISYFRDSNYYKYLDYRSKNNPYLHAAFVYVDQDVQLTGLGNDKYWDVSLKQGWNTVIVNLQTNTAILGTPDDDYVWVYGDDVDYEIWEGIYSGPPSISIQRNITKLSGTISGLVDGKVPAGGYDITVFSPSYLVPAHENDTVSVATEGPWEMDTDKAMYGTIYFRVTVYPDADRKTYFETFNTDSLNWEERWNYTINKDNIDNGEISDIALKVSPISTQPITVTLANTNGSVTIIPTVYSSIIIGSYLGQDGILASGNGTNTMKIISRYYDDGFVNNIIDYRWFRVVSGSNTYITKGRLNINSPITLDIAQMYKLE
jgi:uncharacterized repeat protein (TIGR02543 family)